MATSETSEMSERDMLASIVRCMWELRSVVASHQDSVRILREAVGTLADAVAMLAERTMECRKVSHG